MLEHFFQCPYCWEKISMLLDTSSARQKYVEDCEVCCNPIEINACCTQGDLTYFDSAKLE